MHQLLHESEYDREETKFLINGLMEGFPIGYTGPRNRRDFAKNIPFHDGDGSKFELWQKIMKEVKLGRFAGPFRKRDIPFDHFVQSPVGLVLKGEDGKQTRLIFHLSYQFPNGNGSINAHIP